MTRHGRLAGADGTARHRLFHSPISRFANTLLIMLSMSSFVLCGVIHDASGAGDLPKVASLLKENHGLVFSKDKYGYMPLHYAARRGEGNLAELLLVHGAHISVKSKKGRTPLNVATREGHQDVVELLRRHGGHE